jgi:glutathionylspermidine synthase
VGRGFFPPVETATIRDHVPVTALDWRRLKGKRHVIKPYLEREGAGVRFASALTARERREIAGSDVVYQEELDLVSARIPVATAGGWRAESRVLVFGVYLAGADVAAVYTRAGARVTGREAVFVPTLLRG